MHGALRTLVRVDCTRNFCVARQAAPRARDWRAQSAGQPVRHQHLRLLAAGCLYVHRASVCDPLTGVIICSHRCRRDGHCAHNPVSPASRRDAAARHADVCHAVCGDVWPFAPAARAARSLCARHFPAAYVGQRVGLCGGAGVRQRPARCGLYVVGDGRTLPSVPAAGKSGVAGALRRALRVDPPHLGRHGSAAQRDATAAVGRRRVGNTVRGTGAALPAADISLRAPGRPRQHQQRLEHERAVASRNLGK